MSDDYRNNHYVPVWYQKRFVNEGQKDRLLYFLDLKPGTFTDTRGIVHVKKPLHLKTPKQCFVQTDLYTTKFGAQISTGIEQSFFGDVDSKGSKAVEYFASFSQPSVDAQALESMLLYMSTQKLRTPKGLDWLASTMKASDHNAVLRHMVRLRQLYSVIWAECIWQIADASQSSTKFIVSDHPVTVYNRECGPRSGWCRGTRDPDIRLNATHTIFPLSLDKVLILTNLTWVRNPYQSAIDMRPNPAMFRNTVFDFTAVQTLRLLSEQEVREINFIIKSRAYRYVAGGKEEWLFPEQHVSKSNWFTFGNGYLLMPDPRGVDYSTGIFLQWSSGSVSKFDAYGRTPRQNGYSFDDAPDDEYNSLRRFQGEFAALIGPVRRGRSFHLGRLEPERDDEKRHERHLMLAKPGRRHGKSAASD